MFGYMFTLIMSDDFDVDPAQMDDIMTSVADSIRYYRKKLNIKTSLGKNQIILWVARMLDATEDNDLLLETGFTSDTIDNIIRDAWDELPENYRNYIR